jgi:hypothetical protein
VIEIDVVVKEDIPYFHRFFCALAPCIQIVAGSFSSFQVEEQSQIAIGAILSIHIQKHTKIIK